MSAEGDSRNASRRISGGGGVVHLRYKHTPSITHKTVLPLLASYPCLPSPPISSLGCFSPSPPKGPGPFLDLKHPNTYSTEFQSSRSPYLPRVPSPESPRFPSSYGVSGFLQVKLATRPQVSAPPPKQASILLPMSLTLPSFCVLSCLTPRPSHAPELHSPLPG